MGMGGHFQGLMTEEENYQRQISDAILMRRMLSYVLKFKRKVLMLSLALASATGLNLLPPLLFAMAVDRYISILDLNGLTLLGIAFIMLNFATFFSQYSQSYIIEWLGNRMEYEMRMDMFQHLQDLSIGYYADKEVGGIVSRVSNDVEKITELISSGVVAALADVITIAGIVAIMLWMNARLSLIAFAVIPMIVIFMYFWGRRVRRVYRETRKTIASVSAKIEESVSGMKEIQSFSREKETQSEFQRANASNMQANVEAGRVMSAFWPAVGIFSAIGNSLVLWFGGSAVMSGTLTVGVLFGFMSYITRFFMPIQDLSMFWNNVQSAMAAAERVFGLIDTRIEINERFDAVELPRIMGDISYEGVTFGYKPDQPVLIGVDLKVKHNSTVALVGPTGAGKTTMVNLLYRFYDPIEGRITVDGHDLRELKLESLRSQMAIVLQDPFLFSGTVKENIKYGKLDASDDAIVAVATAVGAHDFIASLPQGYETDVGERGNRLSVGQRQLISLARALLADPRILIMDAATSSIDAYTELIIKQALDKVLRERTSIVIAHRLSTVRNADLIVVIDLGRIVESGTHEELLKYGGLYRRLYETQFREGMPVESVEEAEIPTETDPKGNGGK